MGHPGPPAPRNVLKDVGHLASVSGGAYTAASYVTHLLKAPAPTASLETGQAQRGSPVVVQVTQGVTQVVVTLGGFVHG